MQCAAAVVAVVAVIVVVKCNVQYAFVGSFPFVATTVILPSGFPSRFGRHNRTEITMM